MIKKGFKNAFLLFFILSIILLTPKINKLFAEEIMAPAKSMVVIEGNTNTVLYSYQKDLQLPMASTTKIVTAILSIEKATDINESVKISDLAVGIEGTSIYLKNDETLTIYQLLQGLMLASGNDCAVALAEHFGGTSEFVEEMNNFASRLNLKNTHFENPHGLDSENHYTSTYDLGIITSYALKNEIFREIVSTKYFTIEGNGISNERYLKNKNKLLFSVENCIGVKTGFTDNAGRCLVNASEKDGMQIISVVFNCGPMFEECNRLTNLAYNEYVMYEFIKPYNYVSDILVEDGNKPKIGAITLMGYEIPVKISEIEMYKVEFDLPDKLIAPLDENEVVGKVKVLKNNDTIYEADLYSIEKVKNIDIKHQLDNILEKWFEN